jgi:DegV family protein with EDD domain
MKIKIVADSSANLYTLDGGVEFVSAPLTIRTDEREFVDTADLDIRDMVDYLSKYKGKSGSACPGVGDYLDAFGDADEIYCVTIISTLSGSYNAAMTAKAQYEEENPGKKVFVLDSYSAGPEPKLLVEKIRDLVLEGKDFDTVCKEVVEYKEKRSCLLFCLESLKNLANNGRTSHAVAAICSVIGIRLVGDVKDGLHPTDKCRGEKKAVMTLFKNMKEKGYVGGTVVIDQCFNEGAANTLKDAIHSEFPNANIRVEKTSGLCSFYAEKGGLMIGFERG